MAKQEKKHEPLFHIVKRGAIVWWKSWTIRIVAVLAALVFSGLVSVVITGENPFDIYTTMFKGAFGSSHRIWNLLQALAMLLCVSLAVTPAFKMRFWNIGGDVQPRPFAGHRRCLVCTAALFVASRLFLLICGALPG